MRLSYVKLPNVLLNMNMTANELSVIFYLSSIYNGGTSKHVKVRQSVIAQRCGLLTAQTVSRITSKLSEKGILSIKRHIFNKNPSGTMSYEIKLPCEDKSGYFKVSRHIINEGLSPAQLRVYLYVCRANSNQLGFSWNSYNDLARLIGAKRSDVIKIVSELQAKNVLRKQLVKSRKNARVYVDNRYFIVRYDKHSPIRICSKSLRKIKRIGLPTTSSPNKAFLSKTQTQTQTKHFSENNDIIIFRNCQDIQNIIYNVHSRGSPLNRRSLY